MKFETKSALLAGTAAVLLSTTAMGGLAITVPVEIDTENSIATGDMVTARYSAGDTELIGCGVRIIQDGAGGVINFAFCQAVDQAGETAACNTLDPAMVNAVSNSAAYSFIVFDWNESFECTRIGFSNQSYYLPKKLDSNE